MDEKKIIFNEKQRLKYLNDLDFRNKKKEMARNYYDKKKMKDFSISICNEPKKLSFQ
tara:strand:+ start:165 stop:335 length:171 start_codon:yes stop_codon:yes gene_type:complete